SDLGKGFCECIALKNELRKLKGNSMDTKFAKPSILGKPVLQPPKNQAVVRQPSAFKSKRPNFSKPRFTSQVDVNNILSKPITPHYLLKVRKSAPAKPHHVNAPSSSRNSKKQSYGSNDMAHNYCLEEAKKKTQDKNKNLKPREMPSANTHHTPSTYTPKPRSINHKSRNWPACKSSVEMLKAAKKQIILGILVHFQTPNTLFVLLIQPNKTRNSNKPVDPMSHTQKPGRKIITRHTFSPNKSSAVHEKINTPRSCLRWIPTGRIFNTVGLKWVLTGKTFTSSTTKVDCEPPNGSNECITNSYECDQTLNVSAGFQEFMYDKQWDKDVVYFPITPEHSKFSMVSAGPTLQALLLKGKEKISFTRFMYQPVSLPQQQLTRCTSPIVTLNHTPETQSPILPNDVEEDNHDLDVAHMNNDPFFGITIPENDSEASSLDVIPIVVQTASPNSEHITKCTCQCAYE
ncbi:hypothetical protein Tco_1324883, partial [Tanacetum coccineum]